MSYSTVAQFIKAFTYREAVIATNQDDPAAQQVNTAVLQQALDDASAFIDSYIQGVYTLPLTFATTSLVKPCNDIARYLLLTVSPGDDVRQRYQDAIRFLEHIAMGKIRLGAADAPEIGEPQIEAPDPFFSEQALRGF